MIVIADREERPKRCLGLCILWCDDIHGSSAGSDKTIIG